MHHSCTSSVPSRPMFPLVFPCSSQRASLSIQSQYALSAGLLNSNLKAGSRLATGKLSAGVPAPKHTPKDTQALAQTWPRSFTSASPRLVPGVPAVGWRARVPKHAGLESIICYTGFTGLSLDANLACLGTGFR